MKDKNKGKDKFEHQEAENKKLRKENERLKKQLAKFEQDSGRLKDIEPIYQELLQEQPKEVRNAKCQKNHCGGPIKVTKLPVGMLHVCQVCKDRKLDKFKEEE